MQVFTRVWLIFLGSLDDGWGKGFTALHNRGCSCGLKPPASSRLRAM